jgi:hypothetical protein
VTCITVSDPSLFETLEQKLQADVSVSLLAQLERELLRIRSAVSPAAWLAFCAELPARPIFQTLKMGKLTLNRLDSESFSFPAGVLEIIGADAFQARPFAAPSAAHLLSGWEYSLPVSRSLRARKAYFNGEIGETLTATVKPRILILGGGPLHEADDALSASRLYNAQFVALEPENTQISSLRRKYGSAQLQIEEARWSELPSLVPRLGTFDLIYSPSWLDSCDDKQCDLWLSAAVEMLRAGGRLLAPNFAPGSHDAGWMEACWNWHPHFRSEEDLAQLAMQLRQPAIRGHAVFRDESGASAYLEIHSL